MLRYGRDPRTADGFLLALGAISAGKVFADPPRDALSTTPTSMTQWAERVVRPLIEGPDGGVCPMRIQYEAS
jgi:hypothetical protein